MDVFVYCSGPNVDAKMGQIKGSVASAAQALGKQETGARYFEVAGRDHI